MAATRYTFRTVPRDDFDVLFYTGSNLQELVDHFNSVSDGLGGNFADNGDGSITFNYWGSIVLNPGDPIGLLYRYAPNGDASPVRYWDGSIGYWSGHPTLTPAQYLNLGYTLAT